MAVKDEFNDLIRRLVGEIKFRQLFHTRDEGQRIAGLPTTGTQFTISPVERGEHSLQALVQDSGGQVVCRTGSVTFHVHQPSVQSPTNPARPKS